MRLHRLPTPDGGTQCTAANAMSAKKSRGWLIFLSVLILNLSKLVSFIRAAVIKRCNSYYIRQKIEQLKARTKKFGYWVSDQIVLFTLSTLTILGILARELMDAAERRGGDQDL